jgi:hypothetical protein
LIEAGGWKLMRTRGRPRQYLPATRELLKEAIEMRMNGEVIPEPTHFLGQVEVSA